MNNQIRNCILCDCPLKNSELKENGNDIEVRCPACKMYYYQATLKHYDIDIFNTKEYENMLPEEKQNKVYYQFQENRHRLSGYFFELYEYHYCGNTRNTELWKKMYLPLNKCDQILNSHVFPDDNDYNAKIKKFLKYLRFKSKCLGDPVHINNSSRLSLVMALKPIFYAKSENEVLLYIDRCIEKGFIKNNGISTIGRPAWFPQGLVLTCDGSDYIKESDPDSKKIFVAMAFNDDMLSIFGKEEFRKEIEEKTGGYYPFIVSDREHNDNIDDQIIAEINQSKALIADFTHGNQGAYYEAGYAHGKGIEVIFTCRKNEFGTKQPHFDINHRNFIVWESADDLKKKLINRINATIR